MATKTQILERKQASYDYLKEKWEKFDEYERLFHNQLRSKVTDKTRSQVFDPKLSTLMLERAYRVMAQNPTGKIKAISTNDEGASRLMNMVLDKYILKNANSQFKFLTKLRMADIYSNLYGNFFALVDWDIKADGYIGPDLWLLNIRDVFPQVGSVSVEDSDYIIIRSWQPLSFFESKLKDKEYKNISKIIKKLKPKANAIKPSEDESQRASDEFPQAEGVAGKGYYEVLTMFEKDEWTDYCVDADLVFREIPNPHENGEIPVVQKYSVPLLDDFMGMGDAERGKPMQQVVNSMWNLYLDGVAMSVKPPLLVNKDGVSVMSSIKLSAGAKWITRGPQGNTAVTPANINPKGIDTFNNTYQIASASLLNMFGTTDTSVTGQTEAGFGKTPEALKMQGARENTRDNADRYYMEEFVTSIINKMVNLMSKKNDGNVVVRMFKDEIEALAKDYEEVAEMYDEKTGKLTIDNGKIGDILYDYEIVSGSTYLVDKEQQQENVNGLIGLVMGDDIMKQQALQTGFVTIGGTKINVGELFMRSIANSGLQDWDKVVEEETEEETVKRVMQQTQDQLMQAIEQMPSLGGKGPQTMPPQGVPAGSPMGGQGV